MKKVFLFATAAMLVVGVSFANNPDKGKKKKCTKTTCCSKSTKTCDKMKAAPAAPAAKM